MIVSIAGKRYSKFYADTMQYISLHNIQRLYAIYINLNEFIEAILVRFVKDNNYLKDACSQPTDASFT